MPRSVATRAPAGEALREGVWAVPDQIKTACQISDVKAKELHAALDDVGRA
jgi:hypothetical protein